MMACGELAGPLDVSAGVGVGVLDPRDSADDVSALSKCLLAQRGGARVAQHPFLREGHDLNVQDVLEFLAGRKRRRGLPRVVPVVSTSANAWM